MKKDYFKYLFILAIACAAFIFIDNVSASSVLVGIPTNGSAVEELYQNDLRIKLQNFMTARSVYADFAFSSIYAPNYQAGSSQSYKFKWTMQGSLINKYDSFSFTQGVDHSNITNVVYWLSVNGSLDGFIPCELNTDNSDSSLSTTRFSSFVCRYDNTRIKDTDTVILSFTSFFSNATNNTDNFPRVLTIDCATFFTSDDRSVVDSINNQTNAINKQTESFEEFKNTDISDKDKERPDDTALKDYESAEGELLDKVGEADMDAIDIGIDVDSSSWVWDTTTKLIKSHPAVFGMVISILSIGIIKLALGR